VVTKTAASKHIRAFDPWSYPPPRPHTDVRKLVGDFETVDAAKAERDLRVRHLRMAGAIEHGWLADKLEACAPDARCRSAACPICRRRLRMWFTGAVLEILGEIPDPIAATLIPGDQAVPASGLRDVSLWQSHFHLIAPAALGPTFDEMCSRFCPKSDRICRPVLTQPVNGPAKQVSYCVKSYWPQKVRYLDGAGKKRTSPRRLDNALHADWLAWRDQFPLADFLFLHRVCQYRDELRNARPSGP
jgi:hypothetical protein